MLGTETRHSVAEDDDIERLLVPAIAAVAHQKCGGVAIAVLLVTLCENRTKKSIFISTDGEREKHEKRRRERCVILYAIRKFPRRKCATCIKYSAFFCAPKKTRACSVNEPTVQHKPNQISAHQK